MSGEAYTAMKVKYPFSLTIYEEADPPAVRATHLTAGSSTDTVLFNFNFNLFMLVFDITPLELMFYWWPNSDYEEE